MIQPCLPCLRSLSLLFLLSLLSGCAPPTLFEHEYQNLHATDPATAVIPNGLRRTKNGWEDASYWHVAPQFETQSIKSWMDVQRDREPTWVRRVFAEIRTTPPLMIAVLQITAIAAIVHISRAQKSQQA